MKMLLRMVVEVDVEWTDGDPAAAVLGRLTSTHHPAQFAATGGPMLPAVAIDLPPVVLPQGWRAAIVPVVTEAARELERLRGPK
jgi:hypothetical protein